ncbi:hypothetical protein G6F23_015269 [Rhizopus arrhizus]|nr:hypothetical protein G6F23_015269 [Rhizopus arrhizus]
MASRITPTSSLISVGSIAVVPKRRCACAMVRSDATSGVLLNSAPPPPLTCTSMKPGSSQPPPRSTCSAAWPICGAASGSSALMRPSSITTARSSRNSSPARMRALRSTVAIRPSP